MNKRFLLKGIIFLHFLVCTYSSFCQIKAEDKKKLMQKEDSLRFFAEKMQLDSTTAERMINDSIFTRTLVRALQIKNSFYYPFDSVFGISRLYAPDSSFKIFTWNLVFDDYYSRQKGAIQMRTKDGSLKLFPLRDVSEFTKAAEDSVRTPSNWIGAIYYNMIKTEFAGKKFYTLFGIDYSSVNSSMKWIEVLSFNNKNEPVFGGPFFSYAKDEKPQKPKYRIGIEYKKDARVLANFFLDLNLILVDHLISETDQPELPSTLVPDGDNEGYKWEAGKWVHVNKVFNLKLKDGEAPVDMPLMNDKGIINEEKLKQQSEKNKSGKKKP